MDLTRDKWSAIGFEPVKQGSSLQIEGGLERQIVQIRCRVQGSAFYQMLYLLAMKIGGEARSLGRMLALSFKLGLDLVRNCRKLDHLTEALVVANRPRN